MPVAQVEVKNQDQWQPCPKRVREHGKAFLYENHHDEHVQGNDDRYEKQRGLERPGLIKSP
jgi:hypothetical protein